MTARRRPLVLLTLAALAAVVLGACSTSDLNFRADTRVRFRSPNARQTVQLPVKITWAASELPTGTRFGVFVDRAPVKPGQRLDGLVSADCHDPAGCLTPEALATHGVYVTDARSLVFETLPDTNAGKRHRTKESQKVVLVYIDGQNRRVSESAFSLEFFLKRGAST